MTDELREVPVQMTKSQLLAALEDIIHHIRQDDSWEGRIMWSLPDWDGGDWKADFSVYAMYRVGNSQGQGGYHQIGTFHRPEVIKQAEGGVVISHYPGEITLDQETGEITGTASEGGPADPISGSTP